MFYIYIYIYTPASAQMPLCLCGGQKTICTIWFSPSTTEFGDKCLLPTEPPHLPPNHLLMLMIK